MIHQLLNITRPLFIVDCETTGTDVQRDRIVEIGFQQYGPEGIVKEWRSYVNPCIPMPAGAQSVHGITDEMLTMCGKCGYARELHPVARYDWHDGYGPCMEFHIVPTFKQLAPSLAKGFIDCDFGGKNVRYDLRIIANEMSRAGVTWSYAGARIIDAERLEQLAVPRDLGSLHEKYTGHKHDGAHGALSDVRASTTVIVKQLETYEALPRDIQALHNLQWPNFIDAEGKFRFVDGVPYCFFGKWNGKPMRDIERSYFDWLISSDFGADIKALASEAKLGKYPEVVK